ncbi:hypothetical protein ACFQDF_11910 [Ectobacillus funiculus]
MKGYSTYEQARKQMIFLQHLQQTGFRLTSYIRSFPSGLQYGCFYGKYWLLFQYIQHIGVFRFNEEQNRRQAAAALDEYHCYAAKLPNQLLSQVPFLEWNAKWQMRTLKFQRYTSLISACIGSEITSELLRWAEFSLAELNSLTGLRSHMGLFMAMLLSITLLEESIRTSSILTVLALGLFCMIM